MQKPKINPYIALMIGVLSVSASAILVKASTAGSGVIAFYRLLFTVLLMLPVFITKYRFEILLVKKRDAIYAAAAGVFLAFHFILWFESLNFTSVASSTVLVTVQPIFAFAGAYFFFKERFSFKTIASGAAAICGCALISCGDFRLNGTALWGDILALLACGLVTAYLLFGQNVRQRISSGTYTFIVYTASTVTLFVYVLLSGEELGPYPPLDWLYFILLAVFPNLLGHSLFNWSLKWISTTVISMAILLEPVGASILAYFLLGERVKWPQITGGAIILAALILFLAETNKSKIKEKDAGGLEAKSG
ncbi:DMT family transporter [Bacillus sp. MUM 13]|uniref:DMT family transporter n=1 Tax=Bacillus sp. MUM 13 TaxID=1678001 RepID=UPI0008F5736D|nr:DMT family transporter [Bacillus sp. MUM 13]OIK12835.1 hypothetical protein BIV59_07525 [Bacillus sp. MUM 13]